MKHKELSSKFLGANRPKLRSPGNEKHGVHNRPSAHTNMHNVSVQRVDPSAALPDTLKKWPPVPRYLAAELIRLLEITEERAVAAVRAAWFNSIATGDAIERRQA